ncbi:MAG: DNA polymerase Y family protein [Planctomycetes bacterium]|nr:DNA polymerase Y family protein [Planctomycetota bacterium]
MTMRILCLILRPGDIEKSPAARNSPSRSTVGRSSAAAQSMCDAALRTRLADEAEEFSPLVGWVGDESAAALCLDIGPTAHWFGGEERLLERLAEWVRDRRLMGTAAIADTLGAAWGVAHFVGDDSPAPWRRRIVPPGRQAQALAPLPIAALRLPAAVQTLLHELGLYAVGPLLELSRTALAERFSPELLLRIRQALGESPELFVAHRPPPQHEATLAWEAGLTSTEPLLEAWRLLLPKLLTPLAARGRALSRLLAELHDERGGQGRFVIGLLRPTLDAAHILGLLQLRLEAERVRRPIIGTRLAVLEEAAEAVQQQVLFDDLAPPLEAHAWTTLVERLAGRLGNEAVVRIRLCSDHQPERAWQAVPWLARRSGNNSSPLSPRGRGAGGEGAARSSRSPNSRKRPPPTTAEQKPLAPPRPTILLAEPRPVRVFAVAPHGCPRQYEYEGRERTVVESWGPERIETAWWRGPSIRRDYFRVLTDDGRRSWLFRDLRRNRWFLHGWFD